MTFQMREVVAREKDALAMPAQIGRRAHAIEEKTKLIRVAAQVIRVAARVETEIRHAAAVELGEERPEPVRMFKADGDLRVVLCINSFVCCGDFVEQQARVFTLSF